MVFYQTRGGVSEGSEKTKPLFWGLKKGQKWPKMALKRPKNTLKFYIFRKKCQTGGGSEGSLAKDHIFSGFFFLAPFP